LQTWSQAVKLPLKFDFNVNTIVGIVGFGCTWLWFAFGITHDVKTTKEGLQAAKTEVKELILKNEKDFKKLYNQNAQQASDITAVRVTLEHLGSVISRIEQRQYERRGDVPSTVIPR
jgi:hypothetical protein